jgi:hypothetical protein
LQQKANPTCSSAWCLKQQAQFAEWSAKQVGRRTAFEILLPSFLLLCRAGHSQSRTQPVARCAVAAVAEIAPAAANEWGIVLEDSSVDDPSAASGGAALPEGLFYAFERSAQPASDVAGGAAAGATESVDDLMAQLQGL